MKAISLITGLSLVTFSCFTFANDGYEYIPSIPTLDGNVNNYWESDIFSDTLTIGKEGLWQKDHKTILTFDSSSVDENREIHSIKILMNYAELPPGLDGTDTINYLWQNIKVDIAGPAGFSGSHVISPMDYYNAPIASLDGDILMFGMGYHISLDITEYVNPYGLTQVAVSLPTNPENLAVKFKSGEVIGDYEWDGGPTLFVIYE